MAIMNLHNATAIFGQAAAPAMQQNPNAQMFQTVSLIAIMGVMFYFLMIRPQQKKAKEHAARLKALKPGDKVITNAGIVGTVLTLKENTLTIRSAETKLEVLKSSVAEAEKAPETSPS